MSEAEPGEASSPDLAERATNAALWSLLGFGGGQLVRLAGNLVLTRLLFPEAFGLMAIAAVLLQGLMLFSDFGIGPSIIQHKDGERREFLATAFSIQILRGIALTAGAALAAVPFARFYEDPRLVAIVIVVGFSSFIQGFNSTKVFTVGRGLDLKRLTLLEFASQTVGVTAMIVWALVTPSYWALVAGGLITPFMKMVLSQLVLAGPVDRVGWHRPSAESLLSFGKWIFVSTALTFFAGQSDRLIFAKLIPLDMLGVYSTGAMIALLPLNVFGLIERRVVFPVYSEVTRSGEPLAPAFVRLRGAFLTVGGLICGALLGAGAPVIEFLYDPRYHEAGWILQLLTVGTWFTLLQSTYGAVHLATGRAQWVAASSAAKVVGIVAFVLIGYETRGFPGAVLGYALSEVLRYGVLAIGGRAMKLPGIGQDLVFCGSIALSGGLGFAAAGWLGAQGTNAFVTAAGAAAASALVWLPHARIYLKDARRLVAGGARG